MVGNLFGYYIEPIDEDERVVEAFDRSPVS
jgi:hypothetical protein